MIKREHVDSEDRCKWNNNDEVLQHIVFDAEEKKRLARLCRRRERADVGEIPQRYEVYALGGGQDAQTYECQSLR